jgi:aspartate/methionine/tyrosine aminotransferase
VNEFSERSFSERSATGSAPINAWTRALRERTDRGLGIRDLTLANPTEAGLPYDESALRAALADPRAQRYEPDPRGLRASRQALVDHDLAPSVDRVFLTASTSEAYSHLFDLLADPGDEIFVPQPSYPLLAHLAHLAGVALVPYSLAYDGRWRFDANDLFDAIGERTRAIVAVSPNNPTGNYLTGAELDALASLGLPLIVDEVFHAYPLDAPEDRPRAFTRSESLVFSLDGASKRSALPGLKLAWIAVAGPAEATREACARLEMMLDVYLSPSSASQHALPAILSMEQPRRAILERTRVNLSALRAACEGTAASVPKVEGGWYAPVRMPATRSDEAWAIDLLDDGVRVHPGYFYDFRDDEAWLVLSLLTPAEEFALGVAQLKRRAR